MATKNLVLSTIGYLNSIAGTPVEDKSEGPDGIVVNNVGNYHLSVAYGKYSLHQVVHESGAIRDVFQMGHIGKTELLNLINAYIKGLQDSSKRAA